MKYYWKLGDHGKAFNLHETNVENYSDDYAVVCVWDNKDFEIYLPGKLKSTILGFQSDKSLTNRPCYFSYFLTEELLDQKEIYKIHRFHNRKHEGDNTAYETDQ